MTLLYSYMSISAAIVPHGHRHLLPLKSGTLIKSRKVLLQSIASITDPEIILFIALVPLDIKIVEISLAIQLLTSSRENDLMKRFNLPNNTNKYVDEVQECGIQLFFKSTHK